jgi:predicted small secreted protein
MRRKGKTMKRIVVISVLALLPMLAACHTVQGAGKDISAVGHGVTDAGSQ